jgi:hypothetical protein
MYRQGDFLFIPVSTTPEGEKEKRVGGKLIIGYGEATGHHHATRAKNASIIKGVEGVRWFSVLDVSVEVTHNEHATITIPAGVYEIRQERTYHAGKIQRVID